MCLPQWACPCADRIADQRAQTTGPCRLHTLAATGRRTLHPLLSRPSQLVPCLTGSQSLITYSYTWEIGSWIEGVDIVYKLRACTSMCWYFSSGVLVQACTDTFLQVCWYWKTLCELDQLWMTKCVRLGWLLSFSPSPYESGVWKRLYVENIMALKVMAPRKVRIRFMAPRKARVRFMAPRKVHVRFMAPRKVRVRFMAPSKVRVCF